MHVCITHAITGACMYLCMASQLAFCSHFPNPCPLPRCTATWRHARMHTQQLHNNHASDKSYNGAPAGMKQGSLPEFTVCSVPANQTHIPYRRPTHGASEQTHTGCGVTCLQGSTQCRHMAVQCMGLYSDHTFHQGVHGVLHDPLAGLLGRAPPAGCPVCWLRTSLQQSSVSCCGRDEPQSASAV